MLSGWFLKEPFGFGFSFGGLGSLLGGFLGLLGQQHGLDVGQHATLGDGHSTQQLVQLLIIAHGQLKVTRDNTSLLVVASSVASQLQNLSGQILEHRGQIDRSSSSDPLGVVSLPEEPVDTAHWELQSSTR